MRRHLLEAFAKKLAKEDVVVVEATGNAASVAAAITPHVKRVVIANPKQVRVIAHAKIKTDTIDAKVLAPLYASGFSPLGPDAQKKMHARSPPWPSPRKLAAPLLACADEGTGLPVGAASACRQQDAPSPRKTNLPRKSLRRRRVGGPLASRGVSTGDSYCNGRSRRVTRVTSLVTALIR
jgi:hypothetical protein